MIDIETIKTIATEDWEINWPSKTVLELITRLEAAESQLEAVTQQARMWKMEALTHKETVQECYQACTGSTGEPGDWNGANPVKQLAMQIVEKNVEIARLCDSVNYKHSKICELSNQLASQELVIKQIRDALIHHQKLTRPIDRSYEALAIPTSTEHLEAWYKGQVGDAVAYQEYTEDGKSYYLVYSKQATKKQTPLHAIKPFPFKEK